MIKKGDFIELDYVAKIKESGKVFDLTNVELARKYNLYNPKITYEPRTICVGYKDVIPGLDEFLIGKEIKEYTLEIPPEKAFGKKNPNLIKLVPTKIFKEKKIKPFPGLQINIEGIIGTILTTTGGRTLIDFNNPLAGRTLIYEIKILRIIKDTKEKLNSFLKLYLIKNPEFELKENSAVIKIKKLPDKIKEPLIKEIKERIPTLKEVKFEETTTGE